MRMQNEACKNGHVYTKKTAMIKRLKKYPGREYRECRICSNEAAQIRREHKSPFDSRSLRTATIVREPMVDCWNCEPSPYTGNRGDVRPDPDDGEPKCFACGRGQRATVVLA